MPTLFRHAFVGHSYDRARVRVYHSLLLLGPHTSHRRRRLNRFLYDYGLLAYAVGFGGSSYLKKSPCLITGHSPSITLCFAARPCPSFVQSANHQRKSLLVPGTQGASIAQIHGHFKVADTIAPEDYYTRANKKSERGLAEFERHLILTRTSEGRQRAQARGVQFGRKRKLTLHRNRKR
jgi:hypothetical protein